MRRLFLLSLLCLTVSPALAQQAAVAPVAPAAALSDPYTVTGVQVDQAVSSAQAARDEALLAAERKAFDILKQQLAASGSADAGSLPTPSDAQLAKMVQNFEVAGEKVSARRYSGSFTIRFRPTTVARVEAPTQATDVAQPAAAATLSATYRFASLSDWSLAQQRLAATGSVKATNLQAIGRGYVRVEIHYSGTPDSLNHALAAQGLTLRQSGAANGSEWLLAEAVPS